MAHPPSSGDPDGLGDVPAGARLKLTDASVAEAVALHLQVIGQSVRIRLIGRLQASGEQSVGTLAESLGLSIHNVSQHLAMLHRAGVVVRRRKGREVRYALADRTAPEIYDLVASRLAELAAQQLGINRTDHA